jgi:hypothetical protein
MPMQVVYPPIYVKTTPNLFLPTSGKPNRIDLMRDKLSYALTYQQQMADHVWGAIHLTLTHVLESNTEWPRQTTETLESHKK